MTPDLKDRIIEFLVDGQLIFGLVTAQAMDKLQVTGANGRNRRVSTRTVLIVHSQPVGLAKFGAHLEVLQKAIQLLLDEVDTELLWEATVSRSSGLDASFLAKEYFGDEDSRSSSAALRAALADPIRFRLKGAEVFARSREQVDQQLHQRQVEREREEHWDAISHWLSRALSDSEMEVPKGEFLELLDQVERFLLSRNVEPPVWLTEEEGEIWKRTPILRDFTPRAAAFQLLTRAGRLDPDSDPLLVIAGIEPAFTIEAEQAAQDLSPFVPDQNRPDFSHLQAIAIDDEDTVEVDDAVTLEKIQGGWRVGIHIADVAHFVEPDGALMKEACDRVSSLYLPHRLLTMLPHRLSCELASLNVGELRPVISTLVDIDEQGKIIRFQVCRAQLRVKRRLTYERVDQLLSAETDRTLTLLARLGRQLDEARAAQGAVRFQTPEFKVKVNAHDVISVMRLGSNSPARLLIAELMILGNSLVAQFAQDHEIQLIYRSQGPPKKELEIPSEYDPVALIDVFRSLERSRFGLYPEPHAGLGLPHYAQTTSPLRRLADLLSQTQISAYLQGHPPVFSAEELAGKIHGLGEAERNLRAVERRAVRHFLLKHVSNNYRGHVFDAVVLGPANKGYQVEEFEFALRGRLLSGNIRRKPGDRLQVKVDRIDLEQGNLIFRSI